uniref:WYL domain-containing transcriptional regulator n=1 Tax=Thermorudis sp. TaxID=1969470 RepID=A0A7C2ZZE3_9BACT
MAKREPELQRVARILDILIALSQRRMKRRDLAQRYEVSERQITNDLRVIRERLGIEIVSTSEGYCIKTLPALPSVTFEMVELLALSLAAVAGSRSPGVPQDKLAAALERLHTVLPKGLRLPIEPVRRSLAPTPKAQHREQILRELFEAITSGWTVEMEYQPPMRQSPIYSRLVDPYALVPYLRGWYLIGWCHTRRAWRTFKVDRIKTLRITRTPFERRQEFDLGEFLMSSWGMIDAKDQPAEAVELLFSPPAAHWVAEEQWHHSQRIEWLPDGRLRFTVKLPVTPDFARWVLSYGGAVEVVLPDSLREQVQAHARAILERYSTVAAPMLENGIAAGIELEPA